MSHLTTTINARGFKGVPSIPSEYGGEVCVYESSAASAPHLWLRVECPADLNDPAGPTVEAVAHLTVENARRLAEQLMMLAAMHYQTEDERGTDHN